MRLCIEITIQQRKRGGKMDVDFDGLQKRDDCSYLDIPTQTVGYILGYKGGTLRQFEERFGSGSMAAV